MIKDKLTIVIPCKNEKETLLETLYCIKNQKGSEDIKIIIADCSTDNTRSLVNLYNELAKLNITRGTTPTVRMAMGGLTNVGPRYNMGIMGLNR
jgi:cellulose synthase/poly-beta-1,6-N-acetylglucosamine synthase-like glycosyltransferase